MVNLRQESHDQVSVWKKKMIWASVYLIQVASEGIWREEKRGFFCVQEGHGGGLAQSSGLRHGTENVDSSFIHFLLLL